MKKFLLLMLAFSMFFCLSSMSFADNSLIDIEDTKFESIVKTLMDLEIVNGYPDGTYKPYDVVSRSELTKLLVTSYRLEEEAKKCMGNTSFEDVNSVGIHWASGYINISTNHKFINGYPDGTFKADNTVTYAEAITMCLRVLGYNEEIENEGIWPFNYIEKAQELGLMTDVYFNS